MRNRNIAVRLWLDEEEYATLLSSAKKTGYSMSHFLRSLIMGHIPREVPPVNFWALYKELNAVGNQLNQIATTIRVTDIANWPEYAQVANDVRETVLKIYDEIRIPDETQS